MSRFLAAIELTGEPAFEPQYGEAVREIPLPRHLSRPSGIVVIT
jgi:hypothetical protein